MSSKPNQKDSASKEYPSESRKKPVLTIFDLNEEDIKMGECSIADAKALFGIVISVLRILDTKAKALYRYATVKIVERR